MKPLFMTLALTMTLLGASALGRAASPLGPYLTVSYSKQIATKAIAAKFGNPYGRAWKVTSMKAVPHEAARTFTATLKTSTKVRRVSGKIFVDKLTRYGRALDRVVGLRRVP